MSAFAIYDRRGIVVRTGHCPPEEHKLQIGPGESLLSGAAELGDRVVSGAVVPAGPVATTTIVATAETYDVARARAYPPMQDQMDWLWHAMDGGTLPRVEPFYSRVLAVKQAHPKEK